MKKYRVLTILAFALMVILSISLCAQAADVKWKMATKMPPTSPEGKAFQMFADLVKKKTQGKMEIAVFPAEQLGKTSAILEQLKAGVIQIYPEGSGYLKKFVDDMKFTSLPFLFTSREHWIKVLDSPMVQGWLEEIDKKNNIVLLGKIYDFVRGPFRVMVSKKPVNNLEELKGLKLRLHPDDVQIATWKYLGANTIVLPWTEIYEGLGRGIIQACNAPIALVEAMKFYEQAKYIIRNDEYPQGMAFMTNGKAYKALSPELKKAVLAAHKEACAYSGKVMGQVADDSIARMKKQGVNYSVLNRKPFVDRLQILYKEWQAEKKLPPNFLKTVNALAD